MRGNVMASRRRAGVSQGELAKRTGMYASDISKMERGRMLPTAPRLRRLAEALGVSADYLLGLVRREGTEKECQCECHKTTHLNSDI